MEKQEFIKKYNDIKDDIIKSMDKALRIKREFPCLQAGDDSVFVYTFFWFSIYFLTVSSDICPTDSTK